MLHLPRFMVRPSTGHLRHGLQKIYLHMLSDMISTV